MAEILAQFTPGGEHLGRLEEADRHGPDGALAGLAALVGVGEAQFSFPGQGGAQGGQGGPFAPHRTGEQAVFGGALQRGGQHGFHLGAGGFGGLGEVWVAAGGHQAQAEQQGIRLRIGEHQRWQEGLGAQHVAEAGGALDRGTLGGEGGDVSVEGAQGNAQLLGQHRARDGATAAAEGLQEVEEAGAAGHQEGSKKTSFV